jgi:uncharacterized protein
MKLSLVAPEGANLIRAYAPGELRIGDRTFRSSLIVAATTLIEDWRPRTADELRPADLEPALALGPEILLLGTGARQQFPGPELLAELYARRVGYEVMDTGAACRTYNVLLAEGRTVVAALLL